MEISKLASRLFSHGKSLLLTLLFMCMGAVSAWAATCNVTVTLQTNNPNAATWTIKYCTKAASTIFGSHTYSTKTLTASDFTGPVNGVYTYTGTITQTYNNWASTPDFVVTATPKSGYYYIDSSTPKNSAKEIYKSTIKSDTQVSGTLNLYAPESHPWDNGQTLNIEAGNNASMASFNWNGTAMSGTSATRTHSGSYRTVNGVYLDGTRESTLANSILCCIPNKNGFLTLYLTFQQIKVLTLQSEG